MTLNRNTVIYAASILALLTAGTLAWAVMNPCDCAHSEETGIEVEA
jgi:hypothetical protein